MCNTFLVSKYFPFHYQLALAQKIVILGVIEKICNEALESVHKEVAVDLIQLAVEEMVNTKVRLKGIHKLNH